ncbi:thiamine phosphate synthase [Shewanella submarina]|uniref:Thiamine-phosphate synthase n=1 Tax=Shewanella submarina TaxID=2016376 RepID=A0ABV7GMY2_9GAMM|nr:thiamine phosphate synthase [Shewanella submarina]MCL1036158.1 thiamine phosphate synthase [Shewanella submarina]
MSPDYRLYLVTDERLSDEALCYVVTQAVEGGVTMVQLREKQGDLRRFIHRGQLLKTILAGTGVPLIINDRVDVALAINADGVHLGQSDMPAEMARELLGEDKLLGLTVESMAQLQEAQSLPVDYLGISTVFATPTKTDTCFEWGVPGLELAQSCSQLPLVAIGGIELANIGQVCATGVAGVALVSAICGAQKPRVAARELLARI